MADAGFFFINIITAIVKDRLCVSQLSWFYQRPYFLDVYFNGNLDSANEFNNMTSSPDYSYCEQAVHPCFVFFYL